MSGIFRRRFPLAELRLRARRKFIPSAVVSATKTVDLIAYRFRNEDGNETTATWMAALNTPVTIRPGVRFRLRMRLQHVSGPTAADGGLQYLERRSDGGTYSSVSNTSNPVEYESSQWVSHGTDTTQQLGAGSFLAGDVITTAGFGFSDVAYSSGGYTEFEFSLKINASATPGTVVDLRINNDGLTDSVMLYTQTPQLIVGIPAVSYIKAYDGSSWIRRPLMRYTGTAWVGALLKRWTGSAWVSILPGASDSFDRANGSLGTADSGDVWTTTSGTWSVDTNEAKVASAGGISLAHLQTDLNNLLVQVRLDGGAFTHTGVLFRYTDSLNYWIWVAYFAGSVRLFKVVAGVSTMVGETGVTHAVGDTLKATADGPSINGFRNGAPVLGTTDTFNIAATRAGMHASNDDALERFDDFLVTAL